jgi:hypothetical protein
VTSTAPARTPQAIDPRGPRFNQTVLATVLLLGFVFGVWTVAPVFAVILFLGAAFGPRYGPFLRLYADVVRPKLSPPTELEDPRPPRFAAAVGVVFLSAATVAFVAGGTAGSIIGWILTLIVAGLAALSAATGICVGCELYLLVARRRGVVLTGGPTDAAPV